MFNYRFPSKESVREKWNNFLLENAVSPENVLKTSVICSLHFEQSCFVLDKSRKLLNKCSYPSIIVNRIKGVSKSFGVIYLIIKITKIIKFSIT